MKLASTLFVAFLSITAIGNTACIGTITDEGYAQNDPNRDPDDPNNQPDDEEQAALCVGDGEAGGACEVTADCNAPMVCLGDVCVGPNDSAYTCDPIEGISCLVEGETCVNGLCIQAPGACETLDDCPNGYLCESGQCTPERDGTACADPGPGPALAGVYETDSILHLRDGLPGIVDGILDVADEARDLINGQIDLGLPGIVETLIGGLVSGIIRSYVPPYGLAIIDALAQMSDVLNTMRVEGTLTLEGVSCDGNYRGSHRWDWVTFNSNGFDMRVKPEDLPGVDSVTPEDFGARYHCGDLLIDKHRINNSMGTLVRWVLDNAVVAVANNPNITDVESALASLVDCFAIGQAVNNEIPSTCVFCPNVTNLVAGACQGFVNQGIQEISQAIDDAAVKMSLIKLRAVVPVNSSGGLDEGIWYGSLVGGDFQGTLQMQPE